MEKAATSKNGKWWALQDSNGFSFRRRLKTTVFSGFRQSHRFPWVSQRCPAGPKRDQSGTKAGPKRDHFFQLWKVLQSWWMKPSTVQPFWRLANALKEF